MRSVEYDTMFRVEEHHWWYVSLHELVLDFLPSPGSDGLMLLDAGCGTGRLLELLGRWGTAHGCDGARLAIQFCRKRGVQAFGLDLNTARFQPALYDVITCIDVLYHRKIRDDGAVLRSLHAALKPGGTLILQAPAYEWLRSTHDDAVHTGRRYTLRELERLVLASGFSLQRSTYRVSLLFAPIAAVRVVQKLKRAIGAAVHSGSDVQEHPTAVNRLLMRIQRFENSLLKHISFPFGTSVFIVARKATDAERVRSELREA